MKLIHYSAPQTLVQQAGKDACCEESLAEKTPASPKSVLDPPHDNLDRPSNQVRAPNHLPTLNKDIKNAGIKTPEHKSVPYDQASKRRVAMALVDLCTAYMESLWPQRKSRLPLRRFVFEILRRSRVQYPVFQVALCYLARLGPVIKKYTQNKQPIPEILACSRRVLVAALQVASKFLHDRCYSASVWACISGLPLDDLKRNELALMEALDWNLYVSFDAYMYSCRHLRVSTSVSLMNKETALLYQPTPPPSIPTPTNSPITGPINASMSPEIEIWSTNQLRKVIIERFS